MTVKNWHLAKIEARPLTIMGIAVSAEKLITELIKGVPGFCHRPDL
ncbi:MAG: hypothetical protein K6U11_10390 [bacterium]|nr:hypothetical protein [bacterium]